MGILSFLFLVPLLGGLALLFVNEASGKLAKILAMSISSATLVATIIGIVLPYEAASYRMQFAEKSEWIPALGISYSLGVDGISVMLITLTAVLSLVAIAFSLYVEKKANTFLAMVLILESAMIGAFSALDLILFFTFFEATLVPMWLLINIWGGEKRAYAANKFLVYTFAGSIFLLVGMVALAIQYRTVAGVLSFDVTQIQAAVANGSFWTGAIMLQAMVFWAFAFAFLIKSPSFPFHTWVPDAYGEAPVAGPILSSAMVKLGSYGFLRFVLPLFPDVFPQQVPLLSALAVIGIVYCAVVAAVQTDMRRLLAYSSVSHMGFVLLGIFSLTTNGMMGGAYQQWNHGITATMLFLMVGFLIQRRGTSDLKSFGGLKAQMPIFAFLFLVGLLGSVGLPGTNGFVGEFFALLGMFEAGFNGVAGLNIGYAAVAALGMILAAVYLLYLYQQVFYGPITDPENRRLKDLKGWEIGLASVLGALILWGGLSPNTFTAPLLSSLTATRLMATAQPGQRPTWNLIRRSPKVSMLEKHPLQESGVK